MSQNQNGISSGLSSQKLEPKLFQLNRAPAEILRVKVVGDREVVLVPHDGGGGKLHDHPLGDDDVRAGDSVLFRRPNLGGNKN